MLSRLLRGTALWVAIAQGAACASAAPKASGAESKSRPARVSFSPRGTHHTLSLKDRVNIFDSVAFASPAAIAYDSKRDLYWVSNLNGDDGPGNGFISRLEPTAERSTLNFIDAPIRFVGVSVKFIDASPKSRGAPLDSIGV